MSSSSLPEAIERLDQMLLQTAEGLDVYASLADAAADVVTAYRKATEGVRCSMCEERFDDEVQTLAHMREVHEVRNPIVVRFR